MNVLSISSDRKVFEKGSAVCARLLDYGRLVDGLHVVVFARKSLGFQNEKIQPNIFLRPTNSFGRFFHIPSAIFCALKLKRRGVLVDVVTTQDPFEAGLAGYIIAWIFNAKLHVQIHTDVMSPYFASESLFNRTRVFLAKFLLTRADGIRVVSERIKKSIEHIVPTLTTITVLPILVEKGKVTNAHANNLKKKYPQFDFHILIASRLSREKNIKSAIEAMQPVVATHSKVGLIIVGSGPEEAKLKKIVTRLGLESNVVFEGWQDDHSDYYKTADVLVLPSYYEGYGMVVVEAITAGCPVIMTDVGCAGDIVKDHENGLIVPVGDTPALRYAIERLVSGKLKLTTKTLTLPSKEEYLAGYKKSWEDTLA